MFTVVIDYLYYYYILFVIYYLLTKSYTVNPLYNDICYNSEIRYNINSVC